MHKHIGNIFMAQSGSKQFTGGSGQHAPWTSPIQSVRRTTPRLPRSTWTLLTSDDCTTCIFVRYGMPSYRTYLPEPSMLTVVYPAYVAHTVCNIIGHICQKPSLLTLVYPVYVASNPSTLENWFSILNSGTYLRKCGIPKLLATPSASQCTFLKYWFWSCQNCDGRWMTMCRSTRI